MRARSVLIRNFGFGSAALLLVMSSVFPSRSAARPQVGDNAPKLRLSLPRAGSRDLGTKDVPKILLDGKSLVSYLEKETGSQVELSVPSDYASVVKAMANDEVDIGYLGGLEFVQATSRIGARPLVQREQDREWHTIFITQAQSNINSLKDLSGHTFVLSEPTSVSSRVMPEYWIRDAKLETSIIEKAIHSGSHEATALAVADKKADVGALDRDVYREMMREGKITAQQVRVLWDPPSFANPVWAARKGINPKVAESFSNAFLKLDVNNPEHRPILKLLSAVKYIRSRDSDYALLRKAAKADGLLD